MLWGCYFLSQRLQCLLASPCIICKLSMGFLVYFNFSLAVQVPSLVPFHWFSRPLAHIPSTPFSLCFYSWADPTWELAEMPSPLWPLQMGPLFQGPPHIYPPVRIFWLSQTLLVFLLLHSCGSHLPRALSVQAGLSAPAISVYCPPQFSP